LPDTIPQISLILRRPY